MRATHRHPPTPPPSRWLVPAGLQRHVSQREGASVLSEPANSCPQTGTLPPPCHYSPTHLPSGNKKKTSLSLGLHSPQISSHSGSSSAPRGATTRRSVEWLFTGPKVGGRFDSPAIAIASKCPTEASVASDAASSVAE